VSDALWYDIRAAAPAAGLLEVALVQGVPLRRQELVEVRPRIRLAVTAALPRKGCERAAGVIKCH
jgi:hypothetical protein